MSWTHGCCDECWDERHDYAAKRIKAEYRERENCCYCGMTTLSGIYVRENPAEVPHPKLENA